MDEGNWLLSTRLRALAAALAATSDPAETARHWHEAQAAIAAAGADQDADVALPVLEKSLPDLQALLAAWDTARAGLPAWDLAVLKRAMKAFRRRIDLARADEESSTSRNPLSRGESSGITGVRPPEQYPPDVWDLLVRQGRLRDAGQGILESTAG